MRSAHEVANALELYEQGRNASEIARELALPRPTVADWIAGKLPRSFTDPRFGTGPCPEHCPRRAIAFPASYAYLLGMYLGDGCISSHHRGVFRLRIALDAKYPELVWECSARMGIIAAPNRVAIHPMHKAKGVVVSSYSRHWPCLFPQHGVGRKHERPIELEPWQLTIVDEEPELFLRGLLHSDGCRNLNNRGRGSRWTGIRYTFSNRSTDIRQLFCYACNKLEIHWTQPNSYTISVARKVDTTRLDLFVGPKF